MSAEYRVDYNEVRDNDGDFCVVPTIWIGNQGFDLVRQYANEPISAKEKAEWFASMFKKAIDNYAEAYHKSEIDKMSFEPWIKEVVETDDTFSFMLDGYQTGEIIEWAQWFVEGYTPHEAIRKHYYLYQ